MSAAIAILQRPIPSSREVLLDASDHLNSKS